MRDRWWGWAGLAGVLIDANEDDVVAELEAHYASLLLMPPSLEQQRVWGESANILRTALRRCVSADPAASQWGIAFEYELPFEGGRRPDAAILAGDAIVVLEFKSGNLVHPADVDQVAAYARDLSEYHAQSHGHRVHPVL